MKRTTTTPDAVIRTATLALVLLALVSLLATAAQATSEPSTTNLSIQPHQPTDRDIVRFIITGTWHNGCTPKFDAGGIHGAIIRIDLRSGSGNCTQAFTDWREEVRTNDPLEAAHYEARVYIDGRFEVSQRFQVTETKTPTHKESYVAFRSAHVTVNENDHTATLYVERTGSSDGTVTVSYLTQDGTAFSGSDYELTKGTLTWHHGDTSPKKISVRLYDDFDFEGTENFRVTLEHPSGAQLAKPWEATVDIMDDDNPQTGGACREGQFTLCLQNGRFEVTVKWRTPQGKAGQGNQGGFTDETGYFWFFSAKNIEVLVKVLDGCAINDTYWVYVAGLTNIWVEVQVRDTTTGEVKSWTNPMGQNFRPIESTSYFDCHE